MTPFIQKQPLQNNKKKLLVGGITVATLLLGGGAGALYLNGNFDDSSQSKPAISKKVDQGNESTPYQETNQGKSSDLSV